MSSVSVVIPCRNMAKYVGAAVESALSQTVPVLEILVVDDGSTDETRAVLSRYAPRVRVLDGPGQGSAIARNIGVLAARGDYVAFLDADDLWYPRKIELQLARLHETQAAFCFSDFHRGTDPQQPGEPALSEYKFVAEGEVFSNLLRENFIATSSSVVRRSLLGETGLLKPHLRGAQDYDLWLRIARRASMAWVREPLMFLRKHDTNITGTPEYPFYLARLWEELRHEHAQCAKSDLAYIHDRCAVAAYDAGRHALRLEDLGRARTYLRRSLMGGQKRAVSAFWLLVCLMPAPMVGTLLGAKRRLAHR